MDKAISKEAQEFASYIKKGKLIKASTIWHKYLEGKELFLGTFFDGNYNLLSIKGEKGLDGLCKYAWENDKKLVDETGYKSLGDFIEEVELGNDGFGFEQEEIELEAQNERD